MASTSEELSGQSEQLAEMISFFILDEGTHGRTRMSLSNNAAQQTPQAATQARISHVKSEFESKQEEGQPFEAKGQKDSLDNDFESF